MIDQVDRIATRDAGRVSKSFSDPLRAPLDISDTISRTIASRRLQVGHGINCWVPDQQISNLYKQLPLSQTDFTVPNDRIHYQFYFLFALIY